MTSTLPRFSILPSYGPRGWNIWDAETQNYVKNPRGGILTLRTKADARAFITSKNS